MMKEKRILFVDDDEAIRDAVRLILEYKGYAVTLLSSGNALMENRFVPPDLFILDKQLPGVDGLDICRHLKAQSDTAHIPILILSASPQVARQAQAACADGYLEKPFRMQDLRAEVERLMEDAHRRQNAA